jgi:integrase
VGFLLNLCHGFRRCERDHLSSKPVGGTQVVQDGFVILRPPKSADPLSRYVPSPSPGPLARQIAGLDARREITFEELQQFLNGYVESNTSSSVLAKLIRHVRAILDIAVDRELVKRNPARSRDRKLKAKSRKKTSNLSHTPEECGELYAALSGRDHLAVRILAQLGLRPEELFALRRNDLRENELVIGEALVDGHTKEPKTLASASSVYVPADLLTELKHYLEGIDQSPSAWLFPSQKKSSPLEPKNFL